MGGAYKTILRVWSANKKPVIANSKRKITDLEYWLRLLRVALGVGESLVNPSLFVDEAIDCLFRLSKVLAIFFQNFILIF